MQTFSLVKLQKMLINYNPQNNSHFLLLQDYFPSVANTQIKILQLNIHIRSLHSESIVMESLSTVKLLIKWKRWTWPCRLMYYVCFFVWKLSFRALLLGYYSLTSSAGKTLKGSCEIFMNGVLPSTSCSVKNTTFIMYSHA
jgi:hypothetical protein